MTLQWFGERAGQFHDNVIWWSQSQRQGKKILQCRLGKKSHLGWIIETSKLLIYNYDIGLTFLHLKNIIPPLKKSKHITPNKIFFPKQQHCVQVWYPTAANRNNNRNKGQQSKPKVAPTQKGSFHMVSFSISFIHQVYINKGVHVYWHRNCRLH